MNFPSSFHAKLICRLSGEGGSSITLHPTLRLSLFTFLLFLPILTAQAQNGGGIGGVSTCSSAPQIAAAGAAFALSPQSGLPASQANALLKVVVTQAAAAAPYVSSEIARQSLQAVSQAMVAAASSDKAASGNGSTAQSAITTPEGYKDALATVASASVAGTMKGGGDASMLSALVASIATTILSDVVAQATKADVATRTGDSGGASGRPIASAEDAAAAEKAAISSVVETCLGMGVNPSEVAAALGYASTQAESAANSVASQVAGEVSGQVSQTVALQVSQQVAQQVSQQVSQQATQSATQSASSQQTQNNSQNAPNPTAAGLPGQSQNPLSSLPPILRPTPTPNPSATTTSPTPAPTPAPRPVVSSPGGPG